MGRKAKNTKDLTRGFKGWEKQYIKKSLAYGHMNVSEMARSISKGK